MSESCGMVHRIFNRMQRFSFSFNQVEIPKNGIYIMFEKGEPGHAADRIVRVGTHTGNNQLRSRLFQHFTNENKDRSIFRKNIGRALLNRNNDPFLAQWELDLTTKNAREELSSKIDFKKQKETEHAVTKYMQDNFSFVVFEVDGKADRLRLESRIISTVSTCEECGPSKNWLGNFSPKQKIRESGLWLVNELYKKALKSEEISEIQELVGR